jgi:hypothetical protein
MIHVSKPSNDFLDALRAAGMDVDAPPASPTITRTAPKRRKATPRKPYQRPPIRTPQEVAQAESTVFLKGFLCVVALVVGLAMMGQCAHQTHNAAPTRAMR